MTGNITLTMVKPLAVKQGYTGPILAQIAEAGFRIIALKYLRLSEAQARAFYLVHKDRPFYNDLVRSMTSGPIVAAILEKENAVEAYRALIGPTDPSKAPEGSIRKKFGTSIEANAVHGSDSDDNAITESNFFFSQLERL
ncbi:MAG TPA: nucleoside-diphosphate kinase [Bacteroidales bacterium]|nr:nucleoside-diphosphate kinase [Bacteroidales bacterium]